MILNIGEVLEHSMNVFKANKVYLIEKDLYVDQLIKHFMRLSQEDRRLRFGAPIIDERIPHYVKEIIKPGDFVFAVFNEDGEIVATLHMARDHSDANSYELGLSVDVEHRKKGFADQMFSKAVSFAKTLGAKRIYTYCLGENKAMQHLARKHNLKTMLEYGDVTGELRVADRSAAEVVEDFIEFANSEQVLFFDRLSKAYVNQMLNSYNQFVDVATKLNKKMSFV